LHDANNPTAWQLPVRGRQGNDDNKCEDNDINVNHEADSTCYEFMATVFRNSNLISPINSRPESSTINHGYQTLELTR